MLEDKHYCMQIKKIKNLNLKINTQFNVPIKEHTNVDITKAIK
jgi:hypothetical protein